MDTIIETALLQAEAKGKVTFQSAGLKVIIKKIKIKITETKRELFLGTVERASFSPTDQFRLFVPQRWEERDAISKKKHTEKK